MGAPHLINEIGVDFIIDEEISDNIMPNSRSASELSEPLFEVHFLPQRFFRGQVDRTACSVAEL